MSHEFIVVKFGEIHLPLRSTREVKLRRGRALCLQRFLFHLPALYLRRRLF